MITINTDKGERIVRFKHTSAGNDDMERRITVCEIFVPDENGRIQGVEPESFGMAICAPMDNYSRSEGRKRSFRHAVSSKAYWSYQQRQSLFNGYFEARGGRYNW